MRKYKKMNVLILQGSPRPEGNTAYMVKLFVKEMRRIGHECKVVDLYDMNLQPCLACRNCQKDWSKFGCAHEDDMQGIFDDVMESDLIVFATPVYSFYCTQPMKSVLDRLVYGMNKYYGDERGPSLWKGKGVALISTCGYPVEIGADLLEEGLKRYCKHSQLNFCGALVERHRNYNEDFKTRDKEEHVAEFVTKLLADIATAEV